MQADTAAGSPPDRHSRHALAVVGIVAVAAIVIGIVATRGSDGSGSSGREFTTTCSRFISAKDQNYAEYAMNFTIDSFNDASDYCEAPGALRDDLVTLVKLPSP